MIQKIISNAFKKAKHLKFKRDAKIIIFSDCHRGDNGYADDFVRNRNIYYHALRNYYNNGFTYIELGDGIELWENHNFNDIFTAYKNDFFLLKKFHETGRLHMLWGNHDMVLRHPKRVEKMMGTYFDPVSGTTKELFKDLVFEESIVLKFENLSGSLFLIHGHQADFFNYVLWKFSRFLVRILWKPLQVIGIKDPTSPAKNYKELVKVERRLKKWIENNNNQAIIAGHTHRPRFPSPDELPYFNDGSCVHPHSITGIEIENERITLIKWHTISNEDGILQIVRTVLEGPENLSSYMKQQ